MLDFFWIRAAQAPARVQALAGTGGRRGVGGFGEGYGETIEIQSR